VDLSSNDRYTLGAGVGFVYVIVVLAVAGGASCEFRLMAASPDLEPRTAAS